MSMSNYRVFSENPYPLVQEESIPAISFLDDCGNQFFDKETVQSLLKAKDKQFQQKDKLLLQRVNSSEKEELKAYKKAFNRFDTVSYFVDQCGCPAICKTRYPGDKYSVQKRLTTCYDFHAILIKEYAVDGKIVHLIGISFKRSRGIVIRLLFEKDKFTAKAFYKAFIAAGGSCCYSENSKMQLDLLFGFLGFILDTEQTALIPPIGWFHLDDRWIYTSYKEDCCSDPLLSTSIPLVLIKILAVLKTRMSDKFNSGKYLFAISGNDFPLHIRLTVDNKPKQFDQMLGQYSIAALLPVYGDDPMLTATIGNYRLFLPHEEGHAAALPLTEIVSKLCTLVEHNPDAFERIVEQSYTTALGSLDEECAFRNEIALLSVSSAVLCWALKLLKQPDSAQTTHEVCQAYINNCLSEWDSSLDCNAKEILHKALFSASEAGDIRFIRYEEVDSSYDPERDIVQKKDAFLLKGSLLKSLLHEYTPGYSAPDVISRLQSEHLLSEFSSAKKIRINSGTYVDARLLTLKCSCLTEYEDSD